MDAISAQLTILADICYKADLAREEMQARLDRVMAAGDLYNGELYKPHVIKAIRNLIAAEHRAAHASADFELVRVKAVAMDAAWTANQDITQRDLRTVGRDTTKT